MQFGQALGSAVSTHSRPKAAAPPLLSVPAACARFNTQPPEGGCLCLENEEDEEQEVSTHSRAEAAAATLWAVLATIISFNTQPRGGGCLSKWRI